MSAVSDDTGDKYLSALLSTTAPTPDDNILAWCWVKRPTGIAVGSQEHIFELKAAGTDTSWIRIRGTTGPRLQGHFAWNNSGLNLSQATAYSENTWYLIASYLGKNDDAFAAIAGVWDSTKVTASLSNPDTATESLTALLIGQGNLVNGATGWPGKMAEMALATVAADDDIDTILSSALTTKADAISLPTGATLLHYWPLLDGLTDSVGGLDLSQGGSSNITFDDTDHPSLSGSGGGTSTIKVARLFGGALIDGHFGRIIHVG